MTGGATMEFHDDGMCFACGPQNPIGLKLDFLLKDDGALQTKFTPGKEHQGYANVVHGGILATILDEVMVKLPYRLGQKAVTARMQVTFKRPALVGKELVFTARLIRETRRTLDMYAQAQSADGTLLADARGTFMKI
ncbi:PaaI family thioesterase [bacterium]|nr:PaaI family thioesterase [bacterium]